MIKKQKLQSMASVVLGMGLPGLLNNDPLPFSLKKFSINTYSSTSCRISAVGNALSLKNCADFGEKNPDLKRRKERGVEDVGGFYKTRAFALSRQPLSEMGLRQDEKRLGFLDAKGEVCQRGGSAGLFGRNPLPEKIVVAVDVDEVLGNFVSALNRFIADRYSSNHSVSEYHVYEFFKIWKCSRDEGTSTLSNHHVSYLVSKCLLSLELLGQSTRTLVDVWDNSLTHY
uniref:5'-nucleotidase n=1 Tax=Opuntia streptacantha TaxID=393608 RepID=A0A7C9CQ96_OPUST